MPALCLCIAAFSVLMWRLCHAQRSSSHAIAASTGAFVFLFLTTAWLIANAFTGEGFNGAVIYHLRAGFEGAGVQEYAGLIALFSALVAAALCAAHVFYRLLTRSGRQTAGSAGVLLTAVLWALCLAHPTVNGALRDFNHAIYGPDSLLDHIAGQPAAGERFADYFVSPAEATPVGPRRNLVVIYAESLEQTYFDDDLFPGLITELKKLRERAVVFDDIRQVEGTGFTIAGIVASQCGLPLVTAGHPNSMRGMDRFMSGATCLGDLLRRNAYSLHYLGGADLSFAGKGTFLESHGFESIEGLAELEPDLADPDYLSTWGLYDDSLFELVTRRFDDLAARDEPFGLFTLTMDTHHPHGHPSRSCAGREYADGRNQMLNAVRCSDHLIARALNHILASPAADNTLVVLASDHLALKNDAYDRLTSGTRRNLLWVFPPDGEAAVIDTPGSTLDTAALISPYLGLESRGFGLGRDLAAGARSIVQAIPGTDWQLREWRSEFAAFWELPEKIEELRLDPDEMIVKINERRFHAPALVSFSEGRLETIRFAFDTKRAELYDYLLNDSPATPVVWFDECRHVRSMDTSLPRRGFCFFAGKTEGRQSASGVITEPTDLAPETLERVANSFPSRSLLDERSARLSNLSEFGVAQLRRFDVSAAALPPGAVVRVSSRGGPGAPSLLASESGPATVKRGIQLYALEDDGDLDLVTHLDPCGADENEALPEPPSLRQQARGDALRPHLLVVHDSATCGAPLEPLFRNLPLEQGADLRFREPYIALLAPGLQDVVFEARGERGSVLGAVFRGPEKLFVADRRGEL
jgi:phosphoglycerol transferase